MDGLNLKFAKNPLDGHFTKDSNGALIPDQGSLRMEQVAARLSRQLKADTGLYRRMTDTYYRTDVEFTDNPAGNTPTLGVGAKRYGRRPLSLSFSERMGRVAKRSQEIDRALEKRERKIVADQRGYMALHESIAPKEGPTTEYLQWLTEGDQVMTGGGFDFNQIGDVHKSAMNFILKGNNHIGFADTQFSKLVVEGALNLRDEIEKAGLRLGSLKPIGCSVVRQEQDSDGMIGFPVYSKAFSELTPDIATRLLIDSGIDCRQYVGTSVVDKRTGESVKFRVVDGLAYVLDNTILNDPADAPSMITLLARIQKHGWKEENGDLVPKKSKTRSVYPNSARAGMIEAMIITPFNDKLQELKFRFMPSLQDKPTRVQMIKELITSGREEGYEFLSLDESAYDATVIGGALATVMYYAVRPFYSAEYYDWFDYAIYALVYKYIMCDTALCTINGDEFAEAKQSGPWMECKPFTLFGMCDGLISGAKFTHVGGSLYGGAVIHWAMSKMLGFKPKLGVQAGDDCLYAYPRERVDLTSDVNTYGPVEEAGKKVGIDINKLKQIWHVVANEPVNIFLQDVFHQSTDTWGTGSIFRPLTAVFFSERNKGLSIAEQFMAEIARMNQGSDCYFVDVGVKAWLEKEEFIGLLFKEYGVSAFDKIVQSIGLSPSEIAKRIDVGSFTFGVDMEELATGKIPILPVIARVASTMTFHSSLADALKSLDIKDVSEGRHDLDDGHFDDEPDIGDSDDILGD